MAIKGRTKAKRTTRSRTPARSPSKRGAKPTKRGAKTTKRGAKEETAAKTDPANALRDEILASSDPVDVIMLLVKQVQQRIVKDGIDELTRTELMVLCMYDLVCEVGNGGLIQYFFNSSGDFAREALTSLREIGAPKTAALFERVMGRLGKQATARDRDTRTRAIARLGESDYDAFEGDNSTFYAQSAKVWELTVEYCRAHRDQLRVSK